MEKKKNANNHAANATALYYFETVCFSRDFFVAVVVEIIKSNKQL